MEKKIRKEPEKEISGKENLTKNVPEKEMKKKPLTGKGNLRNDGSEREKTEQGTAVKYVLRTEGLTKIYGSRKVVNAVNMHVRKGDIYGFIGKNGAGKTTFMRMVAGLAKPDSGRIELFGSRDIEKQRMRIGTLIEEPGLYRGMTAAENLEVVRRAYGITDKGIIEKTLAFIGLEDTGKKKLATSPWV